MYIFIIYLMFCSITLSNNINSDITESKNQSKTRLDLKKGSEKALLRDRIDYAQQKKQILKEKTENVPSNYRLGGIHRLNDFEMVPYQPSMNPSDRDRDPVQILIDNQESVEFTKGDDITLTVIFPDSSTSATLYPALDQNGNNQLDDEDYIIRPVSEDDISAVIIDNGIYDQNDDVGIFEYTFNTGFADNLDGPGDSVSGIDFFLMISQRFRGFFYVEDDFSNDYVYVNQIPEETNYSVSGTTNPSIPNFFLFGGYMESNYVMLTMTDENGDYTFYYPDPYEMPHTGAIIMAFNPPEFGHLSGYFPSPSYYGFTTQQIIDGNLSNYDFELLEADSWAEGYLYDTDGNPASSISIEIDYRRDDFGDQESEFYAMTDSSGYFLIPLHSDFEFEIEIEDYGNLIHDYLIEHDWNNNHAVYINNPTVGDTLTINFDTDIYYCDSNISGHIYLYDDLYTGNLYNDFRIFVSTNLGSKEVDISNVENGFYSVSIPSAINEAYAYGNYDTDENNHLNNIIFLDQGQQSISPGDDDIDFYFIAPDGGVEGSVISELGFPTQQGMHISLYGESDDYGYISNDNYSFSDFFMLYMPPGSYQLDIELYDWDDDTYVQAICDYNESILIGESMLDLGEIVLDVIPSDDITISGYVTDSETGAAIANAEVDLWGYTSANCPSGGNENVSGEIYTDENGYFEFSNLPALYYLELDAEVCDFGPFYSEDCVSYADQYVEFYNVTESLSFDFSLLSTPSYIYGTCYDSLTGAALEGCQIYGSLIDSTSNYDFSISGWPNYDENIPNGCYDFMVYLPSHYNHSTPYLDSYVYNICVENESYNLDFYLDPHPLASEVNGYVVDTEGMPLSEADVQIRVYFDHPHSTHHEDNYYFDASTDEFGYYSIPVIDGELQSLKVSKNGYVNYHINLDELMNNSTVSLENAVLEELSSSFYGLITEEQTGLGIMVDYMRLEFYRLQDSLNTSQPYNDRISFNDQYVDEYEVSVPNGCYDITVGYLRPPDGELPFEEFYANNICVTDEDFNLDISLNRLESLGLISGVVVNEDSLAIEGATVRLNFSGNGIYDNIEELTDSQGYYEFDFLLDNASYSLSAYKNGYYTNTNNVYFDTYGDSLLNNYEFDFMLAEYSSNIFGDIYMNVDGEYIPNDSDIRLDFYTYDANFCGWEPDNLPCLFSYNYPYESFNQDLVDGCYLMRTVVNNGGNLIPYYGVDIDSICVNNQSFEQDVYLEPYDLPAEIFGHIYILDGSDTTTMSPSLPTQVYIISAETEDFWSFQVSPDSSGYYSADVKYGEYSVRADVVNNEMYESIYVNVNTTDSTLSVQQDLYIQYTPSQINVQVFDQYDGTTGDYMYDPSSISMCAYSIENNYNDCFYYGWEDQNWSTYLPNGCYNLGISSWIYEDALIDNICFDNNQIDLDVYLYPMGHLEIYDYNTKNQYGEYIEFPYEVYIDGQTYNFFGESESVNLNMLFEDYNMFNYQVPFGLYDIYAVKDGYITVHLDELISIAGYDGYYYMTDTYLVSEDSLGDVDLNYTIDVSDLLLSVNHIMGYTIFSNVEFVIADVNQDDLVDIFDLIQMVNVILGSDEVLSRFNTMETEPVELSKSSKTFFIEGRNDIAGIQVTSKEKPVISDQIMPDGWDLHVGPNGLILLNVEGKGLSDDVHIVFEEDFTFESLQISDWNGNSLDYNIVEIPDDYKLFHAYPNPFNPVTTIKYALPQESKIIVSVYDIRGREVDVLFSGIKDVGYHDIIWDASQYSSGAYFIKMNSGSFTKTQKVMLLK